MKKVMFPILILVSILALPVEAGYADTYIPESQIRLCEQYGKAYGICPELLEALIETESSGQMSARNGSCYGICQINGAVHGYSYDTEKKQIQKACELLLGYECEVDLALSYYNGQKHPHYEGYTEKVLNRAHELEVIHEGERYE